MSVLVCADPAAFADRVACGLGGNGIPAVTAVGLAAGVQTVLHRSFGLTAARIESPARGAIFLRCLRAAAPAMPVIVLSPLANLGPKLTAFDAGACDYVVEPFSPAELAARIRVHLLRADGRTRYAVQSGGLVLDLMRRRLQVGSRSEQLTGRECLLLERLLQTPGEVVGREELIGFVWGGAASPNALDATIARLRRKLGGDARVVTLRGVGHRLEISPLRPGGLRAHAVAPVGRVQAVTPA